MIKKNGGGKIDWTITIADIAKALFIAGALVLSVMATTNDLKTQQKVHKVEYGNICKEVTSNSEAIESLIINNADEYKEILEGLANIRESVARLSK